METVSGNAQPTSMSTGCTCSEEHQEVLEQAGAESTLNSQKLKSLLLQFPMSKDEPDISDASFSEAQCQWLWQQLGRLARMGPHLGTGEQPTTSTSVRSAQDSAGEPGENKGLVSYHCNPGK